MNILLSLFFIPLSFLMIAQAYAIDSTGTTKIFHVGLNTCGKMVKEIESTSNAEDVYNAYIHGFISAVNLLSEGKKDWFEGTDSHARYKFVLKHCENNPLDYVQEAINKLVLRYKDSL